MAETTYKMPDKLRPEFDRTYDQMNPFQAEAYNSLAYEARNPQHFALIASGEVGEDLKFLIMRMKEMARVEGPVRKCLTLALGEEWMKRYPLTADTDEERELTDEEEAGKEKQEAATAWYMGLLSLPDDKIIDEITN
jgi:hypothetical protein